MKYLLLLILTLTPHILNKEVIIVLENKGRLGSDLIKQLNWISGQKHVRTLKKTLQLKKEKVTLA
jgi:hypothetical protein